MSQHVALTDDQYHLLIHGYVRQLSVALKLDIPVDLIEIVNLFFPKLDTWDKQLSNSYLYIMNNGTRIHRQDETSMSRWQNAYGTHAIKPMDYIRNNFDGDKDIFKIWRIKVEKLPINKFIFLGIIPETKIASVGYLYFCCRHLGYGLYGNNNQA